MSKLNHLFNAEQITLCWQFHQKCETTYLGIEGLFEYTYIGLYVFILHTNDAL